MNPTDKAKPKIAGLKCFLADLTDMELREEILKLFGKMKQVQDYYAQELMTPADRKAMLEQYKKKNYGQFYSQFGMPRDPSNAELRNILAEFEQVSVGRKLNATQSRTRASTSARAWASVSRSAGGN